MPDERHSASLSAKADMPNTGRFGSCLLKGPQFASLLLNAGRIVSLLPKGGHIL